MVGLSKEDLKRIRAFADKPRYERDPSELMSQYSADGEEMGSEDKDADASEEMSGGPTT